MIWSIRPGHAVALVAEYLAGPLSPGDSQLLADRLREGRNDGGDLQLDVGLSADGGIFAAVLKNEM